MVARTRSSRRAEPRGGARGGNGAQLQAGPGVVGNTCILYSFKKVRAAQTQRRYSAAEGVEGEGSSVSSSSKSLSMSSIVFQTFGEMRMAVPRIETWTPRFTSSAEASLRSSSDRPVDSAMRTPIMCGDRFSGGGTLMPMRAALRPGNAEQTTVS
eukprot:COSAG06_NODE_1224_length_10198_cov_15.139816_12_plen_155_part_00